MAKYFDLGIYSRSVTTVSSEAQIWFDRGLAWTYGFNHEEAVACFHRALDNDPGCAMAWWGVAYALGPNYNKPWEAFDLDDASRSLKSAFEATLRANEHAVNGTDLEQRLIAALRQRYPSPTPIEDMCPWNVAYADAMQAVYEQHSDDPDIAALYAEAAMNCTPWALWDLATGSISDDARTEVVVAVLEKAMREREAAGAEPHAGQLHMYIHAIEMSPTPERALVASDALRDLVPDAGHLRHMPSHIYAICGDHQAVLETNTAAVRTDRAYLEQKGPLNFYSLYRCHNYHFKIYGAMFLGRYKIAIDTANELNSTLTEELLTIESPPMADWLEGFVPIKQHVLIRFGKWNDIIYQELPDNRELFCTTTAMLHYAKAVAHGALGQIDAADQEAEAFEAAYERVPETRYLFNNTCRDILCVGREMMRGEVEYRRGNFELAFEYLRKAVHLDDNMEYDEPWGWMQPARHALAALLLEQGRVEEASTVYREDLGFDPKLSRACQHPNNVWSLHGYHECLLKLGRKEEAIIIKQQLDLAAARADVPITASCFCRLERQASN